MRNCAIICQCLTSDSNLSTPKIPSLSFPPRSSTITTVSAPVDRLLEYRYLLEELQKIIYQDRVDVLDEEEISRRLLFHFGKLPTKFSEVLDDLIAEAAFLHAEKEVERIKNRAIVKQAVKNAILEQQQAAAAALLEQQSTMTLQQLELDKNSVDQSAITSTRKTEQSVEQLLDESLVDLTDEPQTELERLQQQTEKLQQELDQNRQRLLELEKKKQEASEQMEKERLAQMEKERLATEQMEKERLAQMERERLAQMEKERLDKERQMEKERLAQMEKERLAQMERERTDGEREK